MNDQELVTGNYFNIVKIGVCKEDYWKILDGDVDTILTLPVSVDKKQINELMSIYEKKEWGMYYLRPSKRHCVVIKDKDIEKLASILEETF
tara:strand:- start:412 stop:684 length:273 start_codon:yes stop_codon:yes gene_type:complete